MGKEKTETPAKPVLINEPDAELAYRKPPQKVIDADSEVVDFVALLQAGIESLDASLTETEKQVVALEAENKQLKADFDAAKRAKDALNEEANEVVKLLDSRAPGESLAIAVERTIKARQNDVSDAGLVELPLLQKVNDDLYRHEDFNSQRWLRVETINFRADSGYSTNMIDRAKAAVDRAFNQPLGSLDARSGTKTYDALPPFSPANRVIVAIGVLGEDLAPESSE